MPEVKFIISADGVKAIQAFVDIVRAEEDAARGIKKMSSNFDELDTKAVRASKNVSDYFAKLENRSNAAYEQQKWQRYVEPARMMGGVDLNDSGAVAFVRWQKAQQLRSQRSDAAMAEAAEDTDAKALKLSRAVASAHADIMADHAKWVKEQEAKSAENFDNTMSTIMGGAQLVSTGFYAIAAAGERYTESLEQMAAAGRGFQRDITPLLSLGNYTNQAQIRDRVLSLSEAEGKSTSEVLQSLFNLQAGTPGMSDTGRMRIFGSASMLTGLAGGALDQNITALVKSYQMYGHTIGDVDTIQAKLYQTMQRGYVPMDRLAALLPELLPAAKSFGISFDELTGTLATATQIAGSDEKALAAIRDLFVKMTEAQREGIPLIGSFSDKLHQLSQINPMMLSRIFDERTVALVAQLASHSGQIAKNIQDIGNAKPSDMQVPIINKYSDPVTRGASLGGSLDQGNQNVDIYAYKSSRGREAEILYKAFSLGYGETAPLLERYTVGGLAYLGGMFHAQFDDAPKDVGAGKVNDNMRLGLLQILADKRKSSNAADNFEADMDELEFGAYTDSYYDMPAKGYPGVTTHRYTTAQDAENYVKLLPAHPKLTTGGYRQYLTLEHTDPTGKAADKYLHDIDAGPSPKNKGAVGAGPQSAGATAQASADFNKGAANLSLAADKLIAAANSLASRKPVSPVSWYNNHA